MSWSIVHHGAVDGVTGSCHQLTLPDGASVLVDCGLFQGAETSPDGSAGFGRLQIGFDVRPVIALVVTHVHIDHVGRLPYLLAAGFKGPVVCSEASAELLPMVMRDALEVGFTRDRALIERVVAQLKRQIVPLPYRSWLTLRASGVGRSGLKVKLQPAGHILGSAYVEFDLIADASGLAVAAERTAAPSAQASAEPAASGAVRRPRPRPQRIVFSGDLGAPYTPLLPAPKSPFLADVLVLESTYGDRNHESRRTRRERLRAMCEHAFANRGTLLIPAFSIGRTQELLYELEAIIHQHVQRPAARWRADATRWPSSNSPPSPATTTTCAPWRTWPARPIRPSSSLPAACAAAGASSTTSRPCSAMPGMTCCSAATRPPAPPAARSRPTGRAVGGLSWTASASPSAPASTPWAATARTPTSATCSTSSAACATRQARSGSSTETSPPSSAWQRCCAASTPRRR